MKMVILKQEAFIQTKTIGPKKQWDERETTEGFLNILLYIHIIQF